MYKCQKWRKLFASRHLSTATSATNCVLIGHAYRPHLAKAIIVCTHAVNLDCTCLSTIIGMGRRVIRVYSQLAILGLH